MPEHSRRYLLHSMAILGSLSSLTGLLTACGEGPQQKSTDDILLQNAVRRAYQFLSLMMDLYGRGDELRLCQSYSDQQKVLSAAFIYDLALVIIAYLKQGRPEDIARARVLGNSLLYAQQHDPASDGRLRQAYFGYPFVLPDGKAHLVQQPFSFMGSSVGDLAWAGMAFAQLYAHTHEASYLQGALHLADWIIKHGYDSQGAGGYSAGLDTYQQIRSYKSTEHNIDIYAFLHMLAQLTHDLRWQSYAAHARSFLVRMWNSKQGYFWTGTGEDGNSINPTPIPEDVQSWSYLALGDSQYASSLDWAIRHLTATTAQSDKLTGTRFSDVGQKTVIWFEGTGHLVAALHSQRDPAGLPRIASYLDSLQSAQSRFGHGQTANGRPIPTGRGLVAASDTLETGFGVNYSANLHTGTTAWFCLAALAANPFAL